MPIFPILAQKNDQYPPLEIILWLPPPQPPPCTCANTSHCDSCPDQSVIFLCWYRKHLLLPYLACFFCPCFWLLCPSLAVTMSLRKRFKCGRFLTGEDLNPHSLCFLSWRITCTGDKCYYECQHLSESQFKSYVCLLEEG